MKHRTKITILVATLLVSVALVNVGFAAWVFSNQAERTYEANVFTEPITDRSCVIEDITDDVLGKVDASIHFGIPVGANDPDAWLRPWSDSENEKLTYERVLSVSKNIATITIDFRAYLGEEDETYVNFKDAVDKGLIAAPKCRVSDSRDGDKSLYFTCVPSSGDSFGFVLNRSEYDYSEDPHDTTTLYVAFDFGWGSHFGGRNPYDYYNEMSGDDLVQNPFKYTGDAAHGDVTVNTNPEPGTTAEAREDAFASLWELDRLVDGLTYKFRMNGVAGNQ